MLSVCCLTEGVLLFHELPIAGAYRIELEPRTDERGFFARSFCELEFGDRGLPTHFPQSNLSFSRQRGTLRGIHYRPDGREAKLIRCVAGAAHHVIVDLRPGSSTLGQGVAVELSRDNRRALFIPAGCGHGVQTLLDDTELLYQMSDVYVPDQDQGFRWDDPAFGIEWPLVPTVMSERDRSHPHFAATPLRAIR